MQTSMRLKIRTAMVIILSALFVSLFLNIVVSRSSSALIPEVVQGTNSLLKQATSPLLSPLQRPASPSSQSPAQSAATPSQSSVAPQSAAQPTATTPLSNPAPITSTQPSTPQPIKEAPKPLLYAELQPINLPTITRSPQSWQKSATSPMYASYASSRTSGWIQPSPYGWEFMGSLWYWWLLLGVYSMLGILAWRGRASWYVMQVWLSTQHKIYAN